jgi:hypothetical protein
MLVLGNPIGGFRVLEFINGCLEMRVFSSALLVDLTFVINLHFSIITRTNK